MQTTQNYCLSFRMKLRCTHYREHTRIRTLSLTHVLQSASHAFRFAPHRQWACWSLTIKTKQGMHHSEQVAHQQLIARAKRAVVRVALHHSTTNTIFGVGTGGSARCHPACLPRQHSTCVAFGSRPECSVDEAHCKLAASLLAYTHVVY